MDIITLLFIALGLSMDAFAVSVTSAISQSRMRPWQAVTIAGLFGLFQGLMPIFGYYLGSSFASYIAQFDHFIIFIVLGFVGGKMIYEAVRGGEDDGKTARFSFKTYVVLAVITSIDALSIGLSFAFMSFPIYTAALVIAAVTFVICMAGIFIGKKFGNIFHNKAEIIGGAILILIGAKILLEHLGIL